MLRPLFLTSLFLALICSAWADLKIGTLNTYLLFEEGSKSGGQLESRALPPKIYAQKVSNLASLMSGLDFVALQELGGEVDAQNLAKAAGPYQTAFVQGRDTFTGQDVSALILRRKGLLLKRSSRVPTLENLSKHLLVSLEADGKAYAVLVVHLLRPIGKNAEKHEAQFASIRTWIESIKKSAPDTSIVVIGDFNNDGKVLLPLTDSAALNGYAPTHLNGSAYDHIFSSGKLSAVDVVRPPYPKRPNDLLKSLWTDHYLVKATLSE